MEQEYKKAEKNRMLPAVFALLALAAGGGFFGYKKIQEMKKEEDDLMTKAEIKKMETEKKYDFITRVYDTVLRSIPVETRGYRKKTEVRIAHRNFNRYVRFHAYGQDLAFQIYGDGNIAIEMKEAFHSDHTEQIFAYAADIGKQDAFIAELEEMAPCLMRVFIDKDVRDFHAYMGYVSDGYAAFTAYKQMLDEYHGYCEE